MVRAACAQAGDFELLLPELVSHVLGLLPPRARAVCKQWNELVSSPGFVRQHGERAGNACTDVPTVAVSGFWNRPPVVGFHTELERWYACPPSSPIGGGPIVSELILRLPPRACISSMSRRQRTIGDQATTERTITKGFNW